MIQNVEELHNPVTDDFPRVMSPPEEVRADRNVLLAAYWIAVTAAVILSGQLVYSLWTFLALWYLLFCEGGRDQKIFKEASEYFHQDSTGDNEPTAEDEVIVQKEVCSTSQRESIKQRLKKIKQEANEKQREEIIWYQSQDFNFTAASDMTQGRVHEL